MNKHQLSVSPVVCQAARNLRRVEWLYENDTWRADSLSWVDFWRTQRMMAKTPEEAAAWLPALAFAVSRERNLHVLGEFARWSFPEPLPPEAIPWRDRLIQVWEQCQVWKEYAEDTELKKSMRLMALVRLDRRVERLPEWLREGRRAMHLERRERHFLLAALAGWRPRPGDGGHTMRKRRVAQEWVRLWEAAYKSPELDGLIGTTARLHLAETGWLPSGPSPERLRKELHQWVQQWQFWYYERSVFRMVLTSVPPDASAPEQQQQDIKAWLELTHKNMPWEPWQRREVVWEMLTAWQREGVVERGGIGRERLPEPPRLLPDLARALECERESPVLRAMARYIPSTVEVSAHPEATRAVVTHWEALSRHDGWDISAAAWVARWNLLQAGVLTAEEQTRFDADYVKTSGSEKFEEVLLALARITPPGTFPLDIWTRRLSDQGKGPRLAAQMAIHDWLVEAAGSGQRQRMRQVLRRAGQKVTGTVVPFVNLPHNVLPDFRRLHEIETALAAGQMPPPDAAAENRATPRAVPARLPEAHPRTAPPDITGRRDGSESTPLPS
jgi:hypothetical protein